VRFARLDGVALKLQATAPGVKKLILPQNTEHLRTYPFGSVDRRGVVIIAKVAGLVRFQAQPIWEIPAQAYLAQSMQPLSRNRWRNSQRLRSQVYLANRLNKEFAIRTKSQQL
jgi:hypothetical protein